MTCVVKHSAFFIFNKKAYSSLLIKDFPLKHSFKGRVSIVSTLQLIGISIVHRARKNN